MKKIVLIIGLLAIFTFVAPKKAGADQEGCFTTVLTCGNTGVSHFVVICDGMDVLMWWFLLCGDPVD
jgi:hypothetical protein